MKNTQYYWVLIGFKLIVSYRDMIYKIDDLIFKDGVAFRDDHLFTGITKELRIRFERESDKPESFNTIIFNSFKEGLREGLCREFYLKNKKIYAEWPYHRNLLNGIHRIWNYDGLLQEEVLYLNNKQIEWKEWHNNNKLKSEGSEIGIFEDDDIIIKKRDWYKNSQIKSETRIIKSSKTTVQRTWHESGLLAKEETREEDNSWFLFERIFYKDFNRITFFDLDEEELNKSNINKINSETNYKLSFKSAVDPNINAEPREYKFIEKVKHGVYKSFNDEGSLIAEHEYKDGKLHGMLRIWHLNGKVRTQAFYLNGKKEGTEINWNESGELISSSLYQDDLLIREDTYFSNYVRIECFSNHRKGIRSMKSDIFVEFIKHNGELLPLSEWPSKKKRRYNSDDPTPRFNSTYYNDELDMDQQGPEFWDSQ